MLPDPLGITLKTPLTNTVQDRKFSLRDLIGLPLVWAAAYFVPALGRTSVYLLPSYDLFGLVVVPSLFVVIAGFLLLAVIQIITPSLSRGLTTAVRVIALSLLAVIALKVLVNAAGYTWQGLIPRGSHFAQLERAYKYGAMALMLVLVWLSRTRLDRWTRVLSGLGMALGALAVARIIMLSGAPAESVSAGGGALMGHIQPAHTAGGSRALPETRSRRVVWVIFDETDFDFLLGAHPLVPNGLPNFKRLASVSLFATDANSPASATLYSLPALLTGVPIAGGGIDIKKPAALWLERGDHSFMPFDETTSIFGALEDRGLTASVLGFYQPYCKLFHLQRCDSLSLSEVGGWDVAFRVNVPDFLLGGNPYLMYFGKMTEKLVDLLPGYIDRDDAVTLVHLSIPHLPATYADKVLTIVPSADPLVEYSRNLEVADKILGSIVQNLGAQAARHETVLIVSTDHWLRKVSLNQAGAEVSRKVPFIVWTVGATDGVVISQPLSTVHTAPMILAYLDGEVSTQQDLARWWQVQSVQPSFIASSH